MWSGLLSYFVTNIPLIKYQEKQLFSLPPHKQVRSFVGSLAEVGMGKWNAADMREVLESKDRTECGPVAPPDGLYLVSVNYAI